MEHFATTVPEGARRRAARFIKQRSRVAIRWDLHVAVPAIPRGGGGGRADLANGLGDILVGALPLAPVARALAALVENERGDTEEDEDEGDDYAYDDGCGFIMGFCGRGGD